MTDPAPASASTAPTAEPLIPIGRGVSLHSDLTLPRDDLGIVAFAHGSGSSRRSPRNRAVAEFLQRAGLGTLLFDLLTPEEAQLDARTAELRFDIPMLSERVVAAIDWLSAERTTAGRKVGLFGASTGAAAALVAAYLRPSGVHAIVSRGGRPDLAGDALEGVRAPTVLIVGGADTPVIPLNRSAAARMHHARCELEIIPGATHLFAEPGALELVAERARDWFVEHLAGPRMSGDRTG